MFGASMQALSRTALRSVGRRAPAVARLLSSSSRQAEPSSGYGASRNNPQDPNNPTFFRQKREQDVQKAKALEEKALMALRKKQKAERQQQRLAELELAKRRPGAAGAPRAPGGRSLSTAR